MQPHPQEVEQDILQHRPKAAQLKLKKWPASPSRDLLLAQAILMEVKSDKPSQRKQSRLTMVSNLLMRRFLKGVDDESQRHALLEMLHQVSSQTDPVLAALMSDKRIPIQPEKRAQHILKWFYFGDALTTSTRAEVVLAAENRLRDGLRHGRANNVLGYWIDFLKTYSSYTPCFDGRSPESLGGGYFLKLGHYGCVIDPGHHFLDNFFKTTRTLDDVDGIIVTHFHDDHFADLATLLSLLRQSCKGTPRRVDLFLDTQTNEAFRPIIRKSRHLKPKLLKPSANEIKLTPAVSMKVLPTQHDVFGLQTGVGLAFHIKERRTRLIITGDTGWTPLLAEAYKHLHSHKKVIVAHVSSAKTVEAIRTLTTKHASFYANHLCIHGLCKVIEATNPNIVILSEIGEELDDSIEALAKMISRVYKVECRVGWRNHREYFQ